MNRLAEPVTLVPLGVVTVMWTVPPARSAGEVAVIEVDELTEKAVAGVEPNPTAVASVKLAPVMVTGVPPPGTPATGLTALTVGADW